jgi:hypothetical protein
MSEFDFLSVLVSIIFGLALTHALSGLFRLMYRRELTREHVFYTGWLLMVVVLNWWMFYTWHDYPSWDFDIFLLLVMWALSFFVMAIAIYPPEGIENRDTPVRYRWFHWSVVGTVALDVAQTAVQGALFSPWYYLPFALHYAVLAVLAEVVASQTLRRAIAAWFFVSIVSWALVVRNLA